MNNKYISNTKRPVVLATCFVLVFSFVACGGDESKSSGSGGIASTGLPEPAFTMDAFTLHDTMSADYEQNKITAEEKYKNKLILVTGIIKSVDQTKDGSAKISLQASHGTFDTSGIICTLRNSEKPKALKAQKGDFIAIQGRFEGGEGINFGYISLKDAVVADPPKRKPDFEMSAREFHALLAAEYAKSETAADKKFKNQIVRVSGAVRFVHEFDDGDVALSLALGEEFETLTCRLRSTEFERAKQFVEDERVVLEGICECEIRGLFASDKKVSLSIRDATIVEQDENISNSGNPSDYGSAPVPNVPRNGIVDNGAVYDGRILEPSDSQRSAARTEIEKVAQQFYRALKAGDVTAMALLIDAKRYHCNVKGEGGNDGRTEPYPAPATWKGEIVETNEGGKEGYAWKGIAPYSESELVTVGLEHLTHFYSKEALEMFLEREQDGIQYYLGEVTFKLKGAKDLKVQIRGSWGGPAKVDMILDSTVDDVVNGYIRTLGEK